jgi:hypothetical protein
MNLSDLVSHLDTELRIAEMPDYSNALNGLQLENHLARSPRSSLPWMPRCR